MSLTFSPKIRLGQNHPSNRFAILVLPCQRNKGREIVKAVVNNTARVMPSSAFPWFEIEEAGSSVRFQHGGEKVASIAETIETLRGCQNIIVLGSVLDQHPQGSPLDRYLNFLSQELPGTNFHFIDGGSNYFSREEAESREDDGYFPNTFTNPVFFSLRPRLEEHSSYWSSIEHLCFTHFREEVLSSLHSQAQGYAQRFLAHVKPEKGSQPVFVTSPPAVPISLDTYSTRLEEGLEILRGMCAGKNTHQTRIDTEAQELIITDPTAVPSLQEPSDGYYAARLATIKTLRALEYPVVLFYREMAFEPNRDPRERAFIKECTALGATKIAVGTFGSKAEDQEKLINSLPWLRNFALPTDSVILANSNFTGFSFSSSPPPKYYHSLFDALGIKEERVVQHGLAGSGGEILLGEEVAFVPDYLDETTPLCGHTRRAETQAILEKLGYKNIFFFPFPVIEKLDEAIRQEAGLPYRILEQQADLDYRILLLKASRNIFIAQDYYDRFEAQIAANLRKLTELGYRYWVVEQQFGFDLNVPELSDGSVPVNPLCTNFVAALEEAGVVYHPVEYEPVNGKLITGPQGGTRCASALYYV